jgi:dihydrofolate reductase
MIVLNWIFPVSPAGHRVLIMGNVVLYAAMSLDGYATGPGGDLSRLHSFLFDEGYSDELTKAFHSSGAVVIGRRTYDSGVEPWGDDDVFSMPVFVLAHEGREPVTGAGTTFTFVADGIATALAQATAAAGDREVTVMGSPDVAAQFLRAGLIDEVRLHLVPMLLGGGTPMFGDTGSAELTPAGTVEGPTVTRLRYAVAGRPAA